MRVTLYSKLYKAYVVSKEIKLSVSLGYKYSAYKTVCIYKTVTGIRRLVFRAKGFF